MATTTITEGSKNQAVVLVISELTKRQAGEILKDAIVSHGKHAPRSRGFATTGHKDDVSRMLEKGNKITLPSSSTDRKGLNHGKAKKELPPSSCPTSQ